MVGPAEFQAIVLATLEAPLRDLGYILYAPWSILTRPIEGPDRHLVFRKSLQHNHVTFVGIPYTMDSRKPDEPQYFTVELGRCDTTTPFYSGIDLGLWGGYLPNPDYPPLLPISFDGLYGAQGYEWIFQSAPELRVLSQGVLQRLRIPVLPWLESDLVLQPSTIQKEWLIEPLQLVLDGQWTPTHAYRLVSIYCPRYMVLAEQDVETALASTIIHFFKTGALHPPLGISKHAYLQYLLECLKGQNEFIQN